MQIPPELSSCVRKALSRLSLSDMTTAEMTAYLTDPHRKSEPFEKALAERTVALLVQEGFLDDKRYFLSYVKRLDEKLFGPNRLRQELSRRLFPARYIEAALERKVDYRKRALRLLQKKSGVEALAKTPQGRKKLLDYLARQGYDYATAKAALDQISEEEPFSE